MVAQVMIKLKNVIYFIKSIKFQETGLFFVRIMVLNFMVKMKKVKNMKLLIIYIYLFEYENIESIKHIDEINPNKFSVKAERYVAISMSGPTHFEVNTYLIDINAKK